MATWIDLRSVAEDAGGSHGSVDALDVAAGLIVGALTERLIRRFTGYPNSLTRRL
jgi:hypothetical protein